MLASYGPNFKEFFAAEQQANTSLRIYLMGAAVT